MSDWLEKILRLVAELEVNSNHNLSHFSQFLKLGLLLLLFQSLSLSGTIHISERIIYVKKYERVQLVFVIKLT